MPLIGTRGAVSANALGLFSSGGSNWLSTYATPQLNAAGSSIACDSNGNLYAGGLDYLATDNVIQISKISPFGGLLWQKNITVYPTYTTKTYSPAITSDTNGNVYCLSLMQDSTDYFYTAKYDTLGAFVWGKTLRVFNGGGSYEDLKITIDSAFNVIATGTVYDGVNGYNIQIVKYNSSGAIQWQRQLRTPGFVQDYGRGVTTDSANNIYITGVTDTYIPTVAKYDASGILQWQKYQSTVMLYPTTIDIKSDGTDVYILGGASDTNAPAYLWKYSSSGTLLWQRQLQIGLVNRDLGQLAVVGNNVYFCCGNGLSTVPVPAVVAKYNSSGVIQWQRTIGVTDPNERTRGTGAAVDSKGGLLLQLFGSSGVGAAAIMARLPADGTKTGTYALSTYNVAYTPSTFTESATSFTSATLSATDVATTWLDAAFTPTVTNSSLSYIVTQI